MTLPITCYTILYAYIFICLALIPDSFLLAEAMGLPNANIKHLINSYFYHIIYSMFLFTYYTCYSNGMWAGLQFLDHNVSTEQKLSETTENMKNLVAVGDV